MKSRMAMQIVVEDLEGEQDRGRGAFKAEKEAGAADGWVADADNSPSPRN